MKFLLQFISRNPALCTLAMALFLPWSLYQGSQVITDASVDGLIIEDEEKAYYESVKEILGDDTLVTVLIKSPGGVFHDPILEAVKNISGQAEEIVIEVGDESIPVITHVSSLGTVNKILNKDGFLDTDKLMDYLPEDEEELEQLRADTVRSELLRDSLISEDLTATAVNLYLASAPEGVLNYNQFVTAEIEKLLEVERQRLADESIDAEIFQIGMPTVKVGLADLIARDMSLLIPLCLFVIFGILWFFFRTPIAVAIPIFTGVTSVVGCLAFMSLMGYSINLITNIVPLLLLVIGCTEDIHMLADYQHQTRETPDKLAAIRNMLLKCGLAIVLTSLTSALGFLTLKANPITMLQEFGISAAVGLALNFAITVLVVPTFLRFVPVPKSFRRERAKSALGSKAAAGLFNIAVNHRLATTSLTVILVVLAAWGCTRIKVDADLVSFFKPDNPIRTKLVGLEKALSGGQSFQIVVNTEGMGLPEGAKEPVIMRAMDELGAYLRTKFDYVVSPADYVKVFNREFNSGDESYFRIPDTAEEISQMLLLLEGNEMERILGPDYVNASIVVRHHVYGSWRLTEELEGVKAKIEELFPGGVEARITGEGILFNKASDTMAIGQVTSLAIAVAIIFVIISILFVSPKAGLLAMVPNGMPILLNFGAMGWFGLSLNPGTCTVAVIALGIAIDDTIHLMVQFYKDLKATGDQKEAMRRTLDSELLPVVSSSVALGLGFSVLIFADVVSSVHFGYLASFAMLTALLSDLLIAPGLLISTRLISSWDLFKLKINESTLTGSQLFQGVTMPELKRVVLLGVLEEYGPGDTILKQGADGREMYLILDGRAEVQVERQGGSSGNVKTLNRGDIFGEIAFITGEKRTANVTASGQVSVLRIDEKSLLSVKERFPRIAAKLFFNLSSILGNRLKETTAAWQAGEK